MTWTFRICLGLFNLKGLIKGDKKVPIQIRSFVIKTSFLFCPRNGVHIIGRNFFYSPLMLGESKKITSKMKEEPNF